MPSMRHAMVVGWLAAVAVLSMDLSAWAREAVVTRKDGSRLTGEVVEDDKKTLILKISDIRTPVPWAEIQSVDYVPSVKERYETRKASIGDKDFEGRYNLALWLIQQNAFDLARQEVQELQRLFPDQERIGVLGRALENQGRPTDTPLPTATTRPGEAAATEPGKSNHVRPEDRPIAKTGITLNDRLTDEQVNLIKVYDIDLDSRPAPRVIVSREVIDEVMRKYRDRDEVPKGRNAQDAMRGARDIVKARLILDDLKAREFYSKITVVDDPDPIRTFRTSVHPNYVLTYCGTTHCHGGPNAGKLFIFPAEVSSDRTVYTNYYTLMAYQPRDGKGFMIDQERPDRSYLLQYGMVRDSSLQPHPDVAGWRPMFINDRDPRYRSVVEWIESLGVTQREYAGLNYKPPTPKAAAETSATLPATTDTPPAPPASQPGSGARPTPPKR